MKRHLAMTIMVAIQLAFVGYMSGHGEMYITGVWRNVFMAGAAFLAVYSLKNAFAVREG